MDSATREETNTQNHIRFVFTDFNDKYQVFKVFVNKPFTNDVLASVPEEHKARVSPFEYICS